jgi:excinuclease UvrABC nuclease subunit
LDRALGEAPDRPAVFLVHAREGAPYLARTGLLRRRLRRLLGARSAPGRTLNLRAVASRVEYWPTASRLESSLLHYSLAAEYFPETYLQLIKLRMPPYVRVSLSNPFPRTQVTTRLGGPGSLYFGPFRTRGAAELFQAQSLDLFQVRRCEENLQPSPDHPGCVYGEMNMCLRPCQQAVGPDEYRSEVARLVEFLGTSGRSLVEPLASARDRFSEEMNFEEAARLHKRIEKIEQVAKLRDDLAADLERLCGVAVLPSLDPGAVELYFMLRGWWQAPVRFHADVAGASIDHRLRETVAALPGSGRGAQQRQEHIALLVRWYYSSWRDGDWIGFPSPERAPYRRIVRAVSRIMAVKPPGAPPTSVSM